MVDFCVFLLRRGRCQQTWICIRSYQKPIITTPPAPGEPQSFRRPLSAFHRREGHGPGRNGRISKVMVIACRLKKFKSSKEPDCWLFQNTFAALNQNKKTSSLLSLPQQKSRSTAYSPASKCCAKTSPRLKRRPAWARSTHCAPSVFLFVSGAGHGGVWKTLESANLTC